MNLVPNFIISHYSSFRFKFISEILFNVDRLELLFYHRLSDLF